MSNINYQIVLFKNNKKKKIIKSFVTLDNAKIFYNKKINENLKVSFSKQYENGKRCDFTLGLIELKKSIDSKFNYIDDIGRNVSIISDEFTIIDYKKYLQEELLYDVFNKEKIEYSKFISNIHSKEGFCLISQLNNKIVVQNNEIIELYSLKNEMDSYRLLDVISMEPKKNFILIPEVSKEQKKYLYDTLSNRGLDKKMLYRVSTTHPRE
jgi:hypothetical protein